MIRKPAVAGTFYPGNKDSLREQIEKCFRHSLGPGEIPTPPEKGKGETVGLVSPHAGYVYSGPVAAWGFREIIHQERPETVVILGPNHRGFGAPIAIMSGGTWETPLGKVQIDEEFTGQLLDVASSVIEDDSVAHQREHSLEVQIPFLQYAYNGNFKIVPICLSDQTPSTCIQLGEAIYEVMKERSNVLLVASTDLTHYQPQEIAEREDGKIIEAISSGDPHNLEELISSHRFSMCGYGGVIAIMEAISSIGETKTKLLKYATSGDIMGDYSAVVGYASLSMSCSENIQ